MATMTNLIHELTKIYFTNKKKIVCNANCDNKPAANIKK